MVSGGSPFPLRRQFAYGPAFVVGGYQRRLETGARPRSLTSVMTMGGT
jgi:hypothetical protein